MRVAWYRSMAELRRRPLGRLGLAALVGLVFAVTLWGIAGSRRTTDAYDAMVEDYVLPNVTVFAEPEALPELSARLAELPQVRAYGGVATALIAQEDPSGRWIGELAFAAADERGLRDIQRARVVAGRHMDPAAADEVEINEAWAEQNDLEVGDRFELGLVPPDQIDAAGNGNPIELAEPPLTFEVAGIVRKPGDLAPPLQGVEGTIDEDAEAALYLSSAFWDRHRTETASYGSALIAQLESENDLAAVQEAVDGLALNVALEGGESGELIPAISTAIDIEARALLVASVLLAIVATLLFAQLVRRAGLRDTEELSAMGLDRRSMAVAGAVEWGLVGAVAAVVAVAGAVVLSPISPIGIARGAEPGRELDIDGPVLLIGATALLVAFTLGGALVGWSATRRAAALRRVPRTSRFATWLAASGISPIQAIGVRLAVDTRTGGASIPVRSTLVSGVLGIGALTAAVTFNASLNRVVEDPVVRGWTWDYDVGNYSDPETAEQGRQLLLDNPGVEEMSGWLTDVELLDGVEVPLVLLDDRDGTVAPQALEGALPSGPGEIALGTATLDRLGREVGDRVEAVGPSGEPVTVRIVGETVGISVIEPDAALDEGAILTFRGVEPMLPPELTPYSQGFLVRLADGDAGRRGLAQLREDFPGTVYAARSTPDIENLRRVQWLPRLLVLGVALLALGTIAHALVSAVRLRRRDLAVLKSVGLEQRQLLGVTVTQAATIGGVSLVVGAPLGVAAGRGLWELAADQIGTFAGAVVPIAVLVVGAVVALGLAAVIALPIGRSAARTPTALVLRVE